MDGERLAAITTAVVNIHSECYGRGPTKAKTYAFEEFLLTVMEDILTTVECTLVDRGEERLVRTVRLTFQEATADRIKAEVASIADREVIAYHSQVTFHPAVAFEIFVLAGEGG